MTRLISALLLTQTLACHGDVGDLPIFAECDQNSQCDGDAICEFGRCRPQCITDRECDGIVEGSFCRTACHASVSCIEG